MAELTSTDDPGEALRGIWERHREVVLARLDAIERAAGCEVEAAERRDATRAAHQLAGTVGTFGFARATGIAKELELRLASPEPPGPELAALAGALRCELAGGVGGGGGTGSGGPAGLDAR